MHCYRCSEENQTYTTQDVPDATVGTSYSPTISVDQYNQLMSLLVQTNTNDQETSYSGNALLAGTHCLLSSTHVNNWIIDSGASYHMCSSLESFHTFQEIHSNNSFITIPDGNKIKVTHIGHIKLANFLELKDVLFAPSFKFNLNSVNKLVKDTAYTVFFNSNSCFIQEHSMSQPLLLGNLFQGLYFVDEDLFSSSSVKSSTILASHDFNPNASVVVSSKLDEAKLLHLR